jgi:mycoredoxin
MMPEPIILYGTKKCPSVRSVRGMLERTAVPYAYVDAEQDQAARIRLQEINDGYESVPTLVFADGRTLTEPSLVQLRAHLEADGYHVPHVGPWQAWRLAPVQSLLGVGMVAFGFWDPSWLFVLIGLLLLTFIPTRAYFER